MGMEISYHWAPFNRKLPVCRLLSSSGSSGEAANSKWLNLYYKELQIELSAMRQMQEKVVQGVQNTISRGAGAELPSSKSLISRWLPPLQEAILREQRAVRFWKLPTNSRAPQAPLGSDRSDWRSVKSDLVGQVLNGVTSEDSLVYGPILLLLPAHVLANASLHGKSV